ncbi:MAG: FHA domain-containing protein [Anaerolineae bacterium]|nr:FHA domain-containing protein [Anaerolineae bacterium]
MQLRSCAYCGHLNVASLDFCAVCGNALGVPVVGDDRALPVQYVTPPALQTPQRSVSVPTMFVSGSADRAFETLDGLAPIRACPFCGADVLLSEANFCVKCGRLLQLDLPACAQCEFLLIPGATYCFNCGYRIDQVPSLLLSLVDYGQQYRVPWGVDVFVVGRTVPQQGIYVDLDLGALGQRKVSRQHARFFLRGMQWYVEDLGSKVGTRVFNRQLDAFDPVLVEDSAVIYFADVKVLVQFV